MHGNTGHPRPDVASRNKTREWSAEARAAIASSNKTRTGTKYKVKSVSK